MFTADLSRTGARGALATHFGLALVLTGAFAVIDSHVLMRFIDQAVINYFINPAPLSADRVFFPPDYYSYLNPYWFQHRVVVALAKATTLSASEIVWVLQLVGLLLALLAALEVVSVFTGSLLAKLCFGILFVANINELNIGAVEFYYWEWVPENLAAAPAVMALASFLRGRPRNAMMWSALAMWIHLPTGIYIALTLGIAMVLEWGPRRFFVLNWGPLITAAVVVMPLAVVVVMLAHDTDSAVVPTWVGELQKQVAYGHISLYYRVLRWRSPYSESAVAAIGLVNLFAFFSWRCGADNAAKPRRRLFLLVAGTTGLLAVWVVLVDWLHVTALYPLAFLRVMVYPALLLMVLLVADIPRKWPPQSSKQGVLAALWLVTLLLVPPTAYVKFLIYRPLVRSTPQELAWRDIATRANELPLASVVLVPYDRIDFYRYANRLSPFNVYYEGFLLTNTAIFADINQRMNDFVAPDFLRTTSAEISKDPRRIDLLTDRPVRAWEALDDAKLERLKAIYGITHVIAEAGRTLPGTVLAQNRYYELVRLD
jgi:hypothetical protein